MTEFKNPLERASYFEQALFLYIKYMKYLDDDYAHNGQSAYEYFFNLVQRTSPLFFVIAEGEYVSGFVYLDNITGDSERLHCAELVTCFDRHFWGRYTKICAKIFLNHCFDFYGFKKIKALVYPENSRVKTLLRESGFVKECVLKNETLRNNRLQDIEIYSLFRKAEQ